MTRRFRRRRGAERGPLALGIALASFVALAGIVTFDLAGGRSHPAVQSAALSIDPAAGGRSDAVTARAGERPEVRPTRAGMLVPGELLLESAGSTPRGELQLDGQPVPFPAVLDSVPAGPHSLKLLDEGRVLWESDIRLEPGGVEIIVVPDTATPATGADSATVSPPAS